MTHAVGTTAPLDDITVIEIDNWMAAPSAGAILADLGARVIKIEPLSGDPMRNMHRRVKVDDERFHDYDFQFDVDNRGKESITLNLVDDAAIEIVHKLCATADVFLCNLLRQRQDRFTLDPDSLLGVNPKLVHATLTGYGTFGPEAWRPGYDATAFFARSGLYEMMRQGENAAPPMARPAQGDHTAGLALVGAILGAIRLVDRTGIGQVVETSLFETAVWTQASDYSVAAVDKAPSRPRARDEEIGATANRFPCMDGKWIVVHMPAPAAWAGFCEAIGRPDMVTDERFIDLRSRFRNMAAVVDEIDATLGTKNRDEWGEIFDDRKIVWAPVMAFDEVANDPQAEALDLFPTITSERIGEYPSVAMPLRFHTAPVGPQGPAPSVGEHTMSVLNALGIGESEIARLLADGVIGPD